LRGRGTNPDALPEGATTRGHGRPHGDVVPDEDDERHRHGTMDWLQVQVHPSDGVLDQMDPCAPYKGAALSEDRSPRGGARIAEAGCLGFELDS